MCDRVLNTPLRSPAFVMFSLWTLENALTVRFMIRCKNCKKSSSAEISLLSYNFERIYSSHTSHWTVFTFLLVPSSSSSSSLLSPFNHLAKLLHCSDIQGCSCSWSISSLTTVPDGIFFPLPPPLTFSALFCCNKFISISFIETFALSWETVPGGFLEFSWRFNG